MRKDGHLPQSKLQTDAGHANRPAGREAALLVCGNGGPRSIGLGWKTGLYDQLLSTQSLRGCLPGLDNPAGPGRCCPLTPQTI